KYLTHLACGLSLLTLLGAGLWTEQADPSRQDKDMGELHTAIVQIRDNMKKAEEFEAKRKLILQRIQGKFDVVHEVMNGDLTLLTGAARFRELDEGLGSIGWRLHQLRNPKATYEEYCCRNLIAWIEGKSESPVDPHGLRAAALARELEELLHKGPI